MDEGKIGTTPDRVGPCEVTVLMPTFDNLDMLKRALNSLLQYTAINPVLPAPYHVLIVNNGAPGTIGRKWQSHPLYSVLDTGSNLGWEGGLVKGIEWVRENTRSPFVVFANDDIQFPPNDSLWMAKMLDTMDRDPKVGAIGPVANYSAAFQNFGHMLDAIPQEVAQLMGYLLMVRTRALDDAGGVTLGLPGGDDVDLCLRLRRSGWKTVIQGDVYVHHFGQVTGQRVHKEYWNSLEMISVTRNEMIRRHGLKPYIDMLRFGPRPLFPPREPDAKA